MYDIGNFVSLNALHEWGKAAQKYSYLKEDVVFSIWGNKMDVETDPEDNHKWSIALQALLSEFCIPESLHFKVSAKTGANVHAALDGLVCALHNRLSCTGNNLIVGKGMEDDLQIVVGKPETKTNGESKKEECLC